MKKLSGAEMVVQSLRDEGVEFLFGYPGGSVLDIYDAIHTLGALNIFLSDMNKPRYTWQMVMPERPVKWVVFL